MTWLLLACLSGPDHRSWPEGREPGFGGPDTADTGLVAGSTATSGTPPTGTATTHGGTATTPGTTGSGPTGSGTGGHTGADPTEVCYPGASWDWTACVGVVPWNPGWGDDYALPSDCEPSYGARYAPPARYVDLTVADPDLALAPNFVLSEFMQEWKGPYGVYQVHVVERMQEVRDAVGGPVYVNSGYRSPGYNASVGGAHCSRHMYGDAADFWSNDASLGELADLCESLGAAYTDTYESHVHCDWRDDPLDPAFYDSARSRPPTALPPLSARIVRGPDGAFTAPAEGFDEGEPLRTWRAWGAGGTLLAEAQRRRFLPPAGTVRVEVDVGRHLHLSWSAAAEDAASAR